MRRSTASAAVLVAVAAAAAASGWRRPGLAVASAVGCQRRGGRDGAPWRRSRRRTAEQITPRAVTIDAEPEAVWPWIVQIGSRTAAALLLRVAGEPLRARHSQQRRARTSVAAPWRSGTWCSRNSEGVRATVRDGRPAGSRARPAGRRRPSRAPAAPAMSNCVGSSAGASCSCRSSSGRCRAGARAHGLRPPTDAGVDVADRYRQLRHDP